MNKANILILTLLTLSISCGGPSGLDKKSASNGASSSHTSSSHKTFAKCADVVDMNACTTALGLSGQPLGCKAHVFTKKCVEKIWERAVESGKCGDVADASFCNEHNNIQIAKLVGATLQAIGLCRKNDVGNACEEAPLKSNVPVKNCVVNVAQVESAAEEICGYFQEPGGTSQRLHSLTKYKCEDIMLDPGHNTGARTYGICQTEDLDKACKAADDWSAGKQSFDGAQAFCKGLVKKNLVVKDASFTNLVEEDDYSACETASFQTYDTGYNGQVKKVGSIQGVCKA